MQVKTSTLVTEYGRLTRDSSAANLALGKTRMAYYYDFLIGQTNNYLVEKTKYASTAENQRSYLLPPDYIKMKTLRVKIGTIWHTLTEIRSIDKWNSLTTTTRTSAIPSHWIVINESGQMHIEIDPIPASNGAASNLEIVYEGYHDRLYFPDDYVTGNLNFTQGGFVISGGNSSPTWTSSMVGRFVQIDNGKFWYELKTFTDATHMVTTGSFQEDTVANSSYTIAELLRLPPEYSYTPLWGAVMLYYKPTNNAKSKEFEEMYARELIMIQEKFKSKTKGRVMSGVPVRSRMNNNTPFNYPNNLIG